MAQHTAQQPTPIQHTIQPTPARMWHDINVATTLVRRTPFLHSTEPQRSLAVLQELINPELRPELWSTYALINRRDTVTQLLTRVIPVANSSDVLDPAAQRAQGAVLRLEAMLACLNHTLTLRLRGEAPRSL